MTFTEDAYITKEDVALLISAFAKNIRRFIEDDDITKYDIKEIMSEIYDRYSYFTYEYSKLYDYFASDEENAQKEKEFLSKTKEMFTTSAVEKYFDR